MNPKLAVARALVNAVAVPERRRQLKQLTADIRYEYDQQISQIRAGIAAIGVSAARVMWRAVVRFMARIPSNGASGAAAVRNCAFNSRRRTRRSSPRWPS